MHNSATNISLYSTSSPSPLSIKRLTSIAKSAELSEQLLRQASHDSFVSSVPVSLSAEKWVAADAVNNAETRKDFSKKLWVLINLIKLDLVKYLFLRSQVKTLMLTENSSLCFKKKLKKKRLEQV